MKYKTTGTKAGHKLFIRKRSSSFDIFDNKGTPSGKFGTFTDHKEMKIWEYAAFQKEQFAAIKKRKRKFYVLLSVSIIVGVILFFSIPLIIDWWNSFGEPSYLWQK